MIPRDTWQRDGKICWHTEATHVGCGGLIGTNGTDYWCVICGAPVRMTVLCEVYSRIVGYLRPVQNWNEGKRQEFEDRQTYRIPV